MEEQNFQISDSENSAMEERPKKKRKWLKFFLWVFIFLVLSPVLAFFFLNFILGKDSLPPDDNDLLLVAVNMPAEENSYFDLLKLSSVSGENGMKAAQVKIEILAGVNDLEFSKSYDWEASAVENFLEKNKEVLSVIDDAASKNKFQPEVFSDPSKIGLSMPTIPLNTWRTAVRVSAINAIYLMKQGKEKEAFEEAMKAVIIGHNIEKSENLSFIYLLNGIAIKQVGLETVQVLINYSSSDWETLSYYQDEILKYYSVVNTSPIKLEYMEKKRSMMNFDEVSADIKEDLGLAGKIILNNKFYYKPNKTIKIMAEYYRDRIGVFGVDCSDKKLADERIEERIMPEEQDISWKIIFTENFVGKTLNEGMIIDSLADVQLKKCNVDLMVNATNVLFALKKYYLENDFFPESLNDLAPRYIEKLSTDPYSGDNFILNKERMIFYSLGDDYRDGGGEDQKKSPYLMEDPLFSYDFIVKKASSSDELEKRENDVNNIDTDNDGLSDVDEIKYGTDPNNPDTDGDGLSDYEEIMIYKTDPLNPDTDGDGYLDGDEVKNGYDPLVNDELKF